MFVRMRLRWWSRAQLTDLEVHAWTQLDEHVGPVDVTVLQGHPQYSRDVCLKKYTELVAFLV